MSIGTPIASRPDMPVFEQIKFGQGSEIDFNFRNPNEN